jgi:chaperonin GroEL (HSP60 family)
MVAIAIQIGTFGLAAYSTLKSEQTKKKAYSDTSAIYEALKQQVTTLQEWARKDSDEILALTKQVNTLERRLSPYTSGPRPPVVRPRLLAPQRLRELIKAD